MASVGGRRRHGGSGLGWDGVRCCPARRSDAILVAESGLENGSVERFLGRGAARGGGTRAVHPEASVACEHMFPSLRTSELAQRALAAYRLTRSLLMLEGDDCVDWEVGGSEPAGARPCSAPLSDARDRRPRQRLGQPQPAPQVCVTPVNPVALAGRAKRRAPGCVRSVGMPMRCAHGSSVGYAGVEDGCGGMACGMRATRSPGLRIPRRP
jgi:hypothetical protein